MKNIYSSGDPFQANLILHQLQHNDVDAVILGQELNSVAGAVPFHGLIRIAVPDSQVEKAQKIVRSIESENAKAIGRVKKSKKEKLIEYAKSVLIILFILVLFILGGF